MRWALSRRISLILFGSMGLLGNRRHYDYLRDGEDILRTPLLDWSVGTGVSFSL